jgi:NAD/NADP transhydrogenase alpha subunit
LSGFTDKQYTDAGAVVASKEDVWKCPLVAKVRPPTPEEAARIENRNILSIIQVSDKARREQWQLI